MMMIDLELATVDQMAQELSKRKLPFILIIPSNENSGSSGEKCKMHAGGFPPSEGLDILDNCAEIWKSLLDGDIASDARIIHRVLDNEGNLISEVELSGEDFEEEDDPWND